MQAFQAANMRIEVEGAEKNLVSHLFDIELETTLKNTMAEDEPKIVKMESQKELQCHIDNQAKLVNHLFDGLTQSLDGEIEKFSEHTQTQ